MQSTRDGEDLFRTIGWGYVEGKQSRRGKKRKEWRGLYLHSSLRPERRRCERDAEGQSVCDCLEEIGILTLQHPSVPRKSRIQCLVSHTFSGFCCWNVAIAHTQQHTRLHARTHSHGHPQKITDYKRPALRSTHIHFHIHTHSGLQREECGFVKKCQLPRAKAHLYFTVYLCSLAVFHRILKIFSSGLPLFYYNT